MKRPAAAPPNHEDSTKDESPSKDDENDPTADAPLPETEQETTDTKVTDQKEKKKTKKRENTKTKKPEDDKDKKEPSRKKAACTLLAKKDDWEARVAKFQGC